MQYIFIDESGIHKLVDHSVVAIVYVVVSNIEAVAQGVVEVERRLGIKAFHWAEYNWVMRAKFLSAVHPLPFTAKTFVVENPLRPDWFEHALIHLLIEKDIHRICIDGKKPKWEERRLKKVLRDKGIQVKKLRAVNDESEPGIRLADALAGLVRSFHDNPHGNTAQAVMRLYRNKITAQLVGGQVTE